MPDSSAGSSGQSAGSFKGAAVVVVAALLMLATLPGRTQGLGLITEPLLNDLHLDRVTYAHVNLWATLLGALACLPIGGLIDRWGSRRVGVGVLLALALVVGFISRIGPSVGWLFVLLALTRALGQSALSVVSITAVGKWYGRKPGLAMGAYSVLVVVFFAFAFKLVGSSVNELGWRTAWQCVAWFLVLVVTPLTLFGLFERPAETTAAVQDQAAEDAGMELQAAVRTSAFWVFAGGAALFGLVSSGLGLFNEAVLAERGFDRLTYYNFLVASTLASLVGQLLCGWWTQRGALCRVTAVALFLYAAGLLWLPFLQQRWELWSVSGLLGTAGGMITVTFFAVWSQAFGRKHLGRIQAAGQMVTVVASATGPLLFAQCHQITHSYSAALFALVPVVLLFAIFAWFTILPLERQRTEVLSAEPEPAR